MCITLKLTKTTDEYYQFALPDVVEFREKTYKMTSPANLIRALNKAGCKLTDVFNVDQYEADSTNMKIHRRLLWLPRHRSNDERSLYYAKKAVAAARKARSRLCPVCGNNTIKSRYMIGTCGDTCRSTKIAERNQSVARTHWTKRGDADEIRARRIATRVQNDRKFNRQYVPWNKGKTGIYSKDTIEKIRAAALKQFHEKKFRKTKIELKYEQLLIELGVEYTYSMIFQGRQYDFYLPEQRLFIEIQGDFWHANPSMWGNDKKPLREHQKMKRIDDKVKRRLVLNAGYELAEFWEHDICNDWSRVVDRTLELVKR